ncbi:NirD/YgiW/YdeI family stress tolerance protein [Baaleninema sp.]|uniref:NirD/YgiW/YdeI family stress tolerance protein n=1 Tax=Baaleninema sp. TaxID=3101197 RepID=UPI003D000150
MKLKYWLSFTALTSFSWTLLFPSLSVARPNIRLVQNTSIGELQNREGITISGEIVAWGEADENEFVLQDSSGQVVVDAGPRWWQNLNLNLGDTVTVQGEMDDGEFDAFSITYANGTTVFIRNPEGPPPWAGGRRNVRPR